MTAESISGPDEKKRLLAAAHRAGKAHGARLGDFIDFYFSRVPFDDLAGHDGRAIAAMARGHLDFAKTRKPSQSRVRVFTPDLKKDGWSAPRSVIEIVTDDMPFLVDSLMAELNRHGLRVHLVIHPTIHVSRNGSGVLTGFGGDDAKRESFMHFQVSQIVRDTASQMKEIEKGVNHVLANVRAAVEDWPAMRARVPAIIDDLVHAPRTIDGDEIDEACAFLQWLHDDQFTFLGYREYTFRGKGKNTRVEITPGSGLGVLRNEGVVLLEEIRNLGEMPKSIQNFVANSELLTVTKTNRTATVHRAVHMDYIGIKILDDEGNAIGERVFAGLFTSTAYNRSPRAIPLLRRKIDKLVERAGFAPASHDGKAFLNILETYPRDELFQASEDDLYDIGIGILHLRERQRVALFLRMDDFERFASCLVFIPRDGYTSVLRRRIQNILAGALNGEVSAHYATLGDEPLARLHIIIHTEPGAVPHYDVRLLEARVAEEARSWTDRLQDILIAEFGEQGGLEKLGRYANAFPQAYQERFDGEIALQDIRKIDEVLARADLCLRPYRPAGEKANRLRFKVYHPEQPLPLSDVLPMLEHLGLRVIDEVPFAVHPLATDDGGQAIKVMIHDFGVETRSGVAVNLTEVGDKFREAFHQIWRIRVESDGFNALILNAGLDAREISLLRAYAKYLRQAGSAFSQAYMEETLIENAAIAGLLVALFEARFAPDAKTSDRARAKKEKALQKKILGALDAVTNADQDRIVRRFMNLILSTLRTNYYQTNADGAPSEYISFKLDSKAVEELPLPRPLREIFVCSPRVEGVHLRFGLVARGGLRWSDRREDFRTEILGLVKAQQVKNAVIVPVGSKGGFVVKNPPTTGGRDAFMAEGIACYQTFINGLLDITDNLNAKGKVVPPKNVVRHDGDDPYLVVAADKGTATFSDIANAISEDHGFWLGDAFASGGSQGYDHKKMGITARGGWESVKRHFREMGLNTQKEDFTVVGVGDMSGDVFGNGMLLSKHIKLQGAFNHLHIFVDPNPDQAKSFAERKRLFKKARSSWSDYDTKVMSRGGRIFERSAKSLTLTPEIKSMLGLSSDKIAPNDLIKALLKHHVDLLWFGGIGTYVKATHQNHVDAGDRTNDQVRINAHELNCKVIGEGANLGMTQPARIEYALAGGRLNTDSIDNSAGVDCSDHEVNIKILLDQVVAQKKLSGNARNKLLADMTDDVAEHVLRDNYLQTQAMTLVQTQGTAITDHQMRLMRMLEKMDRLNRDVENLPDDETLGERVARGQGLTRPEISVVISYSKIWVYDEILASDLPDDPELTEDLVRYFPDALQNKYSQAISDHRLKREIITTRLTNSMINRVGGTFVTQHMEKTGMKPVDIARAYTVAAKVFALRDIWSDIEAMDNRVPAQVQTAMLLDVNRLVDRAVSWLLRNASHPIDIGQNVATYRDGVAIMAEKLKGILPRHYRDDLAKRAKPYIDTGVPKALAMRVSGLLNLSSAFDIVHLADQMQVDVAHVARVYYAIGTRFRLGHLRAACERLEAESHWQKLAVAALLEEIFAHQVRLCAGVLSMTGAKSGDVQALIADWVGAHEVAVERTDQMLVELWAGEVTDLSMITVASRGLGALASGA